METQGSYEITLKSQLGLKNGNFVFSWHNEELIATFTFLGRENILHGKEKGGTFEVNGEIATPLGLRECKVVGALAGSGFNGEIMINGEIYPIKGVKLKSDLKGDEE